MKKYNNPQMEIVCLNTADVVATSEMKVNNTTADFTSTTYTVSMDDGFWS